MSVKDGGGTSARVEAELDAWLRRAWPGVTRMATRPTARRLQPWCSETLPSWPPVAARAGTVRERDPFDAVGAADSVSVLLHGSRADGTACNFSDVDVIAVVWPGAVRREGRLRATLVALTKILRVTIDVDPLQHHLPKVVVAADRAWRWEMHPPLFSETLAWVSGPDPRGGAASVRPLDREAAAERLKSILGALRVMMRWNLSNAYLAKGLISTVMLLPALHAQAGGSAVSKAAALADPPRALGGAITLATQARATWSYEGEEVARRLRHRLPYQRGVSVVSRLPAVRTADHLIPTVERLRTEIAAYLEIARHDATARY